MAALEGQRVTHEQFRRVLHGAAAGIGAGLACRYDARNDETVWTINGHAVGLTVGRIGATRAYYLAEPLVSANVAAPAARLAAGDRGSNA
ncbi:hypothetical protein [Azohydromonas australica]|uniref:hypothetical protein n=1 Tax=Azohydromonas australica TaxID=364039 RepID=UPI00040E4067|nr:hypothetical protein [Azohydromonas australica]